MKRTRRFGIFTACLLCLQTALGQCDNSLYGVSSSGGLYTVNTTTGVTTSIVASKSGASQSNGLAYAGGANPTFYYFLNSNAGKLSFESYSQTTGTFATPITWAAGTVGVPTGTVNAACITPDYKGYYCMDTNGFLYYYNIAANAWTRVANAIRDQTGTVITDSVSTYSSGDMAFDGSGNLWMLLGNSTTKKFGLYELPATVPTTRVDTVTIYQKVALGSPMPDGNDPVGIAFNAAGQMYISTLNTSSLTAGHLYQWNSASSTPQQIGGGNLTASSGLMLDLASCTIPTSVLPVTFRQVSASLSPGEHVRIVFSVAGGSNIKSFTVEHSTDANTWQAVGTLAAMENKGSYSLLDDHPVYGRNFYRVRETDWNGSSFFSSSTEVQLAGTPTIRIWPNPVGTALFAENPFTTPRRAEVWDASGRKLLNQVLQPGVNRLSLATLPSGVYILRTRDAEQSRALVFVKGL